MTRRIQPREGLIVANISHRGNVRRNNEDSYGYFEHPDEGEFAARGRLAVVADGMGGQAAGEVASCMAIRCIRTAYYGALFGGQRPEAALEEAIQQANALIAKEADRDESKAGMGTTVTAVLVCGERAWVAHVGDSRAYLMRRWVLRQVTEDHSRVWELVRSGFIGTDAVKTHPFASAIYRSLGVAHEVEVDVTGPIALEPNDRFLICSDGLTDMVNDEAIAEVLGTQAPPSACKTLVELAREHGGKDNITVQILAVPAENGKLGPRPETAQEGSRRRPTQDTGLRSLVRRLVRGAP
ncbi:MAG: Stp1/IreP family PP2C-type Ser/Thr phosphatase [Candidatus Schekmanbacteria bacterium]|nr:Stp1/IreP family PP2C-type Ser/Thr phosphatase [Candidatus Schekmanbacteria bacterium]